MHISSQFTHTRRVEERSTETIIQTKSIICLENVFISFKHKQNINTNTKSDNGLHEIRALLKHNRELDFMNH